MPTFKIRKYRTVLYAICAHNYQVFKVSTGVSIPDKYWDFQNHRLKKNCPEKKLKQSRMDTTMTRLVDVVNELQRLGIEPLPSAIRKLYYPDSHSKEPYFAIFRRYIQMKKARVTPATIQNLKRAMGALIEYVKVNQILAEGEWLTKSCFADFIRYQIEDKKYSDITLNLHIRKIREFMTWAYPEINIDHIKYSPPPVQEPIFLTSEELNLLITSNITEGYLNKARDLFLFCCLTGMRYSDSQLFKPEWINDGIISYRMKKTGGRAAVPNRDKIAAILNRYGGLTPRISSQKFNDYLKVLFKNLELNRGVSVYSYRGGQLTEMIKPLSEVITSHIARKTFITQCLLNNIPIQDVMKMSGHSDYKSMRPYIAITNQHLKEVAKRWEI